MTEQQQPDLTVDTCPTCGGMYLNKGELNTLATAMEGDIEYCSVDHEFHKDNFPVRNCPNCADQQMTKINLLRLSDLIFDYCPKCEGFFLDKGELELMNRELRSESPNKAAEEYREKAGRHVVHVDQTDDAVEVSFLGVSRISKARYIRISVFPDPQPSARFHVGRENWPMRLAKSFGLHPSDEIETGDPDFDSAFAVHGGDSGKVRRYLTESVRRQVLDFANSDISLYGRHGSLDMTDRHITYVEGPYTPESIKDVTGKARPVINALVAIADAMANKST
jgi:Zn-finger nucleic acid-binding protein